MNFSIRDLLSYNLQAIPGQGTERKFIVIESDDWGGIRMPSAESFNRLVNKGLPIENDRFNKFDNLASKSDLAALYEILNKFSDSKGKHPILTINVTTANPNFDGILSNQFKEYKYEPFYKTIEDKNPGALKLWNEGIENNLILPQYHGRDHVHVHRWLEALRSNDPFAIKAFDDGVFGIVSTNDSAEYYTAAYDYQESDNIEEQNNSIAEGLKIFEDYFKFTPKSFIPPAYICNLSLLKKLKQKGVVALQGKIVHLLPKGVINNKRNYKKLYRFPGYNNKTGMVNLVRNVFFEPSMQNNTDWITNSMMRIAIAFKWNKPAVISSHRVNYIGSIIERNRNEGLTQLKILIGQIIKKWPDVEFISSQELSNYYLLKKQNLFS